MGVFVVRDIIEKSLIDQGDIKGSPSMMNLITTTVMRKWKT